MTERLACCDLFPSHFVVTVFESNSFLLVDSISENGFWTSEQITTELDKIEHDYAIDKWISSEERKIFERAELSRK